MARIATAGEALVEVMRTERDCPLDRPGGLMGPFPSGAPAIFASAAARLGGSVGTVGAVGEDAFGECLRARLCAEGIDCAALACVPDRLTGIAFVAYRSDGGRSFVFHLQGSAAADVCVQQVPATYLDDAEYIRVMGSSLCVSETMRQECYELAARPRSGGAQSASTPTCARS